MSELPLIVDLDGTLIHTDMLHESTFQLVNHSPLALIKLPFWLTQGKAQLKRELAHRSKINSAHLPYNQALLEWLRTQKEKGRQLILCTASDNHFAEAVAKHLGLFDEVIATHASKNLSGENKAALLEARFGHAGFDYAGNAPSDVAVWKRARRAVLVNASTKTTKKAHTHCEVETSFPAQKPQVAITHKLLRTHQWAKNALLFMPIIAAHEFSNPQVWISLIFAFFAFSLCASSVYIMNDLLDLESDRAHPRKCKRPFASGQVPVWIGVLFIPILLLSSLSCAHFVGTNFLVCLGFYFLITCAYSFGLKRLVVIDCITLAMLYTMRIIAGAAASQQAMTFWILAFSIFLFLSLGFVKRYVELKLQLEKKQTKVHGRGYYTTDAPLIQAFGIASGYTAVLVLALYLNSEAVLARYTTPEYIWGTLPLMLFWISRVWMQAHRGKMHDDPVVFALKDKASLLTGVLFLGVLIMGAMG